MADTESILQLGIEAARAGDKEEARNLFRLLTRETPDDAQAWLWLAGVAEDREEKRAALEQVVRLDPSNDLARQGLAALGGPSISRSTAAPPPRSAESPSVLDDTDDFAAFDVETAPLMTPLLDSTPHEPIRREPTRELSPDEEFAMSLDSLGSMSTSYQDRVARGGDANDMVNFDIPDFGEDEFDVEAYMKRDRVDPSQIELTEEDLATRPSRHARASGGALTPILLIAAAVAVAALIWFLFFRSAPEGTLTAADQTATAAAVAAGGGTVATPAASPGGDVPTLEPGGTGVITDVNPPINPTAAPPTGGEQPGGGDQTPGTPGQVGVPNAPPELVNAQPQLLPTDGFTPVQIVGWFFNYGGASTVVDGALGDLQPAGRWLIISPLMFNATGQSQPIPGDLVVLKDAQGRVYSPNPNASVAAFNANPSAYNIQQYENAPQGFNFTLPLVFDVAPDATDLVLFSPYDTSRGYLVRNNLP